MWESFSGPIKVDPDVGFISFLLSGANNLCCGIVFHCFCRKSCFRFRDEKLLRSSNQFSLLQVSGKLNAEANLWRRHIKLSRLRLNMLSPSIVAANMQTCRFLPYVESKRIIFSERKLENRLKLVTITRQTCQPVGRRKSGATQF